MIYGPTGEPCAEAAVTALAASWAPRQGGLTTTILVGCDPPDGAGGAAVAQVLQAVAGEGAAGHVRVRWAEVTAPEEEEEEEEGEQGEGGGEGGA